MSGRRAQGKESTGAGMAKTKATEPEFQREVLVWIKRQIEQGAGYQRSGYQENGHSGYKDWAGFFVFFFLTWAVENI